MPHSPSHAVRPAPSAAGAACRHPAAQADGGGSPGAGRPRAGRDDEGHRNGGTGGRRGADRVQ